MLFVRRFILPRLPWMDGSAWWPRIVSPDIQKDFSLFTPYRRIKLSQSKANVESMSNESNRRRSVRWQKCIFGKSRSLLLSRISEEDRLKLSECGFKSKIIIGSCDNTPTIPDNSVALVVTSPPFLDVVNYEADNWLRCWFNEIDPREVKLWTLKR